VPLRPVISLLALCLGLSACGAETASRGSAAFTPDYGGVDTRLLDGDLVSFLVEMRGARDRADVHDYAECAAAQYALIRGYGFARHLRTNVMKRGDIWQGDAVYTISAALPRGLKTIDAEVVASHCVENGIPMV
jgi:hypothetical protein